MKKKTNILWLMILLTMLAFTGCPSDLETKESESVSTQQDKTKITALQIVVDSSKSGDTIDLSQYPNMTEYQANINKSLTIKNGADLKGEALTVSSDGVVLDNIHSASVNTSTSLKISGSSLSSLSVMTGLGIQQSCVSGRGAAKNAPKIDISSSSISSNININVEDASLTICDVSADKVKFNADNTQLTIEDKTSKINNFATNKICQVVLEDGTSDTIPCTSARIDVTTDQGKLTQINMKAAETLILTQLSPKTALPGMIMQDQSIDFSDIEIIGTYMSSGAVTVFTAELTYEIQSTFTKKEKDFTVKIDDNLVYSRINHQDKYEDYASLDTGYHNVIIEETTFPDRAQNYEYSYTLAVIKNNSTPVLTGLEIITSGIKSEFLSGEGLDDIAGLVVNGIYQVDNGLGEPLVYRDELSSSEYELSSSDANVVDRIFNNNNSQAVNITVTVTSGSVTSNFTVKVYSSCIVKFNYGYKLITKRIKKGDKIARPSDSDVSRAGYVFIDWYSNEGRTLSYNFNGTVSSEEFTLYAKWTKNYPRNGRIAYLDKTTADETTDKYIFVDEPLQNEDPVGVVFEFVKHWWINQSIEENQSCIKMINVKESYSTWCNSDMANISYDTSDDDGSVNWDIIKQKLRTDYDMSDSEIKEKFPAFKYCDELLSEEPNNPWYIPSFYELYKPSSGSPWYDTISSSFNIINNSLKLLGSKANPISDSYYYWSSSQYKLTNKYYTYSVNLKENNDENSTRTSFKYVRAIRNFTWHQEGYNTGDNQYTYH